jgi:hypothetical protein
MKENAGASDQHLEGSINPARTRKDPVIDFADQSDGKPNLGLSEAANKYS